MKTLLGIDIGTSSAKAMLMDLDGQVLSLQAEDYDVDIPQEGYAQQDPEIWWKAVQNILLTIKSQQPEAYASVGAIGFSGQMHSLVTADKEGNPVYPAIVWLDQRSQKQLEEINRHVKKEELARVIHNRVFTGFAFPSLLWMKENQPESFRRIYKIMTAKDFIRLKMTGVFGTDVSDASSTTGFDMKKRDWAWEILGRLGLPEDIFPECHESMEIAGYTTKECEEQTGLPIGIPVIYGAGDQPAHTIGSGVIDGRVFVSNIGTGGQVAVYSPTDAYDPEMRIHTFCHGLPGAYTIFGAHLCSGMSLKWLKNQVLGLDSFAQMNKMAEKVPAGSDGLLYLPYLTGSRTPRMDAGAQGLFFGLQLRHNKNHFVRAVMEGVIYDFHEALDIFREIGIDCPKIIACGGGAQSPTWLQIQADILNKEVQVCENKEQACLGACMMAGAGTGLLDSLESACQKYIRLEEKVYRPIPENAALYQEKYAVYKQLYEAVKDLYE